MCESSRFSVLKWIFCSTNSVSCLFSYRILPKILMGTIYSSIFLSFSICGLCEYSDLILKSSHSNRIAKYRVALSLTLKGRKIRVRCVEFIEFIEHVSPSYWKSNHFKHHLCGWWIKTFCGFPTFSMWILNSPTSMSFIGLRQWPCEIYTEQQREGARAKLTAKFCIYKLRAILLGSPSNHIWFARQYFVH